MENAISHAIALSPSLSPPKQKRRKVSKQFESISVLTLYCENGVVTILQYMSIVMIYDRNAAAAACHTKNIFSVPFFVLFLLSAVFALLCTYKYSNVITKC